MERSTLVNGYTYTNLSPIQNTNITTTTCTPNTAAANSTVNCTITTNVNLNTLSGSVNLRIGVSGTVVNCPVTGSGTSLVCSTVSVGATTGTFPIQYNASGSGSTYVSSGNIVVTTNSCTGTPTGPTLAGETVTLLCIQSGAITPLYAGDSTNNNDLCETGNITTGNYFVSDSGVLPGSPLTCSSSQQRTNFSPIYVKSSRQTVTTTIYDILFEDLTGSEDNTYSVSGTISNLENGGNGSDVVLGTNPDTAGNESSTDTDAPTSTDSGKLYCTIDPSTGSIAAIIPTPARSQSGLNNLVQGPKTTVIDNITSVNIFNTSSNDVLAGRYDIDNVDFKCRIPAYVDQGTYTQNIVLTVVAS